MKNSFHKIIACFLATIVVFATMSFTINMHYCGGALMDFEIYKQAKTCGMDMENPVSKDGFSVSKNSCCKDIHVVVKGQDELKISFETLTFHQQQFVAAFAYTYRTVFVGSNQKQPTFLEYPPPNIVKSIYKLDETYLI